MVTGGLQRNLGHGTKQEVGGASTSSSSLVATPTPASFRRCTSRWCSSNVLAPLQPTRLLPPHPFSTPPLPTASRRRQNKVEFQGGWLNSLTFPPLQADWAECAASSRPPPHRSPASNTSHTSFSHCELCSCSQRHRLLTHPLMYQAHIKERHRAQSAFWHQPGQ